jgi:two-component system response regulator (stage 0 sporulation protein F)
MPNILVIDDQPAIRRLITDILTEAGYQTIEADGGTEGIAAFEQYSPFLIVTDMVMADGEGVETIRELRRRAPDVPILATSGLGDLYLRLAISAGASGVLEKPFDNDVLLARVNKLLSTAG